MGLKIKLFGKEIFEFARSVSPENPAYSLSDPAIWDAFDYSPSKSGVSVNDKNAITFSAVWSAVTLISRTIAALPFKLYERTDQGKALADNHPLYNLLSVSPNYYQNAFNFRDLMQAFVLLWGNAYAQIIRDSKQIPIELNILHPSVVTPVLVKRKIYYNVSTANGQITLASYEMLHLRGPGFDPLQGKSMIQIAAEAIGLGLSAQDFASMFFKNGGNMSGVIEHPGHLEDPAINNLQKSIKKNFSGNTNAHKVIILDEGMKYNRISIPAQDAQLIETRKFQVEEIARIYHVPLHKLQSLDRATNNNIEHQAIEYVQDCLLPWLVCWETECCAKLLMESEKKNYFFKFNITSLLRGDTASRGEFYSKGLNAGWFSVNEIRELEDMNKAENCDDHYVQVNLQNITDPSKNPSKQQTTNSETKI